MRKNWGTGLPVSLFFIALFSSLPIAHSTPSSAQLTCASFFDGSPVFGRVRLNFKHNTKYTKTLDTQSSVKDQCGFGTCHIYSWTSHLEHDFNIRFNRNLVLSDYYLVAKQFRKKVFQALYSPSLTNHSISMGESVNESQMAIRRFGLVPEAAWKGRRDFMVPAVARRLEEYVQNIIARAKYERSLVMTNEQKVAINNAASKELEALLDSAIGVMPEKFEYYGETYTPETFRETFFRDLERPLVYITTEKATEKNTYTRYSDVTMFRTKADQMAELTAAAIDNDLSVYLTYDNNTDYVDKQTGIMSLSAFHVPDGARPLPFDMRLKMGIKPDGHAVQVVGYDRDPKTKKIRKFLIKNSWGEKIGDKGYFHMYMDYFAEFALGVSFYRDAGIKLPDAEQTKESNVQLELKF